MNTETNCRNELQKNDRETCHEVIINEKLVINEKSEKRRKISGEKND